MMSISAVTSSSGASSYYEVDDYYTKENSGEHTHLSRWEGKGAELQGLNGPVNPEDFRRVLDGVTPDGQELGRVINNERVHRSGLDLTFSPPKSVAIMAQVFGDERVVQAHNEAVKDTLKLVENFAAKARVTHGTETHHEKTQNLTIATFFHTSTRAQDPGMHTHSVISNMTLCDDGKWRSVSNEDIWSNSKARYGENYSMNLAKKLNDLGYEIVATGRNAEYEIAGVPKELINEFSTRSRKISELLDERGLSGPKNREWAALQTRDKKVPMDKKLEQGVWKERASSKGFDLSHLVKESYSNVKENNERHTLESAQESVINAMEHLSQRSASFSIQNLVQEARNLCIGKVNDHHINRAISNLREQEVLLEPGIEKGVLTTRDTVATENDNLLKIDFGKNLFKPITTEQRIQEVSDKFTLNDGQRSNLRMVGTSPDRFMSSQGWAGVGKTHFAKAAKEVFEESNLEVIGLSPSAKAASELEQASGIKSGTLASFIFSHQDKLDPMTAHEHKSKSASSIRLGQEQRKMIVVDESSFVSSQDMNKLMTIAEALDARVLKMGDYKQLGSVDAGAPFEQGLDHGIRQENLTEVIRQKSDVLREAVYDAINGDIGSSMAKINVVENDFCQSVYQDVRDTQADDMPVKASDHREEMRYELSLQAANEYLSLSPTERANTALIVPSNVMRTQVNELIREELVKTGEVDSKYISVSSLRNTGLTDAQMKYAQNYEEGNIVRFNTKSEHHNIQQGEYYSVLTNKALMGRDRYLELQSTIDPSKSILIHPKEISSRGERAVEVFEKSERELAAGDTIRWTRNDKPRDIVNTETAQVLSVDTENRSATLLFSNDKQVVLDMNDLKNNHLDYNFSNTVHAAQGATVDNVITVAESWHKLLTNQRSFYVQISRAKHNVKLITDSKELVTEQISNEKSESVKALDLYTNQDKPLDLGIVSSINDALKDGVTAKQLYSDLVVAFEGDKYAAQEHMQNLGVDFKSIEREISVEAAIDELETKEPVDSSNSIENDSFLEKNLPEEQAVESPQEEPLSSSERPVTDRLESWADFDSDLLSNENRAEIDIEKTEEYIEENRDKGYEFDI